MKSGFGAVSTPFLGLPYPVFEVAIFFLWVAFFLGRLFIVPDGGRG